MRAAGRAARREGVCYLTGGSSAVLLGWRQSTLDIDVRFEPEQEEVLRELPRLKRELQINVELASPGEFIPLPAGWRERSPPAGREGALTFRHFDFASQALAKLERGHERDLEDVAAMLERRLIDAGALRVYFEEIEPQLYRFPAISPERFRARVEQFTLEGGA
jgi:hypothetical protein